MDGGLDWLTQRLSGRKVNWGQVGQAAAIGCLSGMLGAGLGAKAGTRATNCNSFTADTPVVMADGTRKPIQDVQIGDSVLATDPETGDTGPRKVTTLITGSGDKQLVDLTVDTDGTAGAKTATINATDDHPFWVPDLHQWIDAGDLTAGQWLRTSAGTWVQITALDHRTQPASVYNLTVDDLHTYYIAAGSQDLLVHNSTCLLGTSRDIKRHIAKPPGDFDADFLNIPAMRGPGRWNWTRNKRFIDEALASGKPIHLVTDPTKPLYTKGNVYQRELKYLQDKGYGWRTVDGLGGRQNPPLAGPTTARTRGTHGSISKIVLRGSTGCLRGCSSSPGAVGAGRD
ncbi:polymorphic toxin-type HINT domain-containing protein [Streptomyces doebereineriae]|uniref:Polymorphic toxin-type HINT domain-containing protein n=1 Tax=Streptomyces doebereineriae TaxID=3075528 RepID=A0ABU2VID0_9ACTN|nr:polymorphic toxin-type HINT domain-containing protein [Streptomyces sp. DSM 41640]MDT0485312.1 polymorphic toxin-type HINT domain-containing protein [Streptomyces sp. DSM 41640]